MLMKAPGFSAFALNTLAPVLLGQGEPLLHGLDLHALDRQRDESQKEQVPGAGLVVSFRDGMNRTPIACHLPLVGARRDRNLAWIDDEYREVGLCDRSQKLPHDGN
jgi:hypothetical protein